MDFLTFREQFFKEGCFSIHQVYAWQPGFTKNNLTRWAKKGRLLKLRNGFYSFPEYLEKQGYRWVVANCIYRPSYISLHSALAYYGMIPEAVVQTTSTTTLKTHAFKNAFGEFSYKSIRENLFFGYEYKPMSEERGVAFASPEKAILDLLYLYPFYNNNDELDALRLDADFMENELDKSLLEKYLIRFQNKALQERVELLIKIYGL